MELAERGADLTVAFTFLLGQNSGSGVSGGFTTLAIFIVFIVVLYFALIRPTQKQRKQHDQLVRSINKGDTVMTAGGIYGTVTKVKDDYIMLEIARKTEVKLSRGSIAKREIEAGAAEEAPGSNEEESEES